MFRLLIVDNERMIVDGLVELFETWAERELEVIGAYSVKEALSWLERAQIDVVLSDIRMPVMTGLELQKEINAQWPRCKVIFLSGYRDFSYVQEAVRNGSVDYLLKTEGHPAILAAVDKALRQSEKETEADRLIRDANVQMKSALPVLRNRFFGDLLQGDAFALRHRGSRFSELQLSLDSGSKVLLLIGRIDEWGRDVSAYDRSLLLFAVQNIAEELLKPMVRSASAEADHTQICWFIQPDGGEWSRVIRFVHGTMEKIQTVIHDCLQLAVSFAADRLAADWTEAPVRYERLRRLLYASPGADKRQLLIAPAADPEPESRSIELYSMLQSKLGKIELLNGYLENGQEEESVRELWSIMSPDWDSEADDAYMRMQIYYSLVPVFLKHVHRSGRPFRERGGDDLRKLTDLHEHRSWEECMAYFRNMVRRLSDGMRQGHESRERETIRHIRDFIAGNLHGDLSLVAIGEAVGLNSFYLSRFYKQTAGEALKDYIARIRLIRAKELLQQQEKRISDVSQALGFLTETYFYRFFKKMTNMTPQEYRDSLM